MVKRASKATKKFAASGQLKKTIQARKKHQQVRKRISGRRGAKNGKPGPSARTQEDDDASEDEVPKTKQKGTKAGKTKSMTVDDILSGGFMDASDSGDDEAEEIYDSADEGSDLDEEAEAEIDDDDSFSDVDDLDGEIHLQELSKLAEKDPEFYQYLQENDKDLLDFDPDTPFDVEMDEEDEDEDMEDQDDSEERLPSLTLKLLNQWQRMLLQQRSLRALRKLLIAFRSAAHMNEEGQVLAWSIDSSSVYNKLVTTALRYTPVILEHHVPYKTLPDSKFKPPVQTKKFKTLQKMILSYFQNVIHLISNGSDDELLELAVKESSKLVPYIISSRKTVKLYLKKCLELWSSGKDSIRIAAFLSMRKLATSSDSAILSSVQKGTYLSLVRSSKQTSSFTLPSITLMKNSASEIFCMDHGSAYQHAFGYIRQLAIHLRNSMKIKSKEAYKQVHNWQFVHCVDFWSIVLARACSPRGGSEASASELSPLIYPLVQVSLGAIKLVSSSRCYPFHFHIIRSLLHLTQHTDVYIPLAPYIVPVLTSTLSASSRPKSSTLKPLDLEVQIRAPQQYLKTKIYTEAIVEEATFLLAEWFASRVVQGSVAFPEVTVPVVISLRKALKSAKNVSGKEVTPVKTLVERVEESARWVEQKRKSVTFGPGNTAKVEEWQRQVQDKIEESPMAKYTKILKKAREKRRQLLEKASYSTGIYVVTYPLTCHLIKAQKGEDEILDD
ncbi:hypothetical protein ONZ45_g11555 [Pleurotus djamor]|nr:hypothetical protein ONZ45_g11555 [Pleurotus djamor]